jgi:succinate-semialdehyde dehydrogenase/glutarate-semialdehyde dehydrogenase
MDGGFFLNPSLVGQVGMDAEICQEELFGPVAVVLPYDDVDEAVRLANATRFGLGSNAWTSDPDEQEIFIRDLAAGQTFINGMTTSFPPLPFGGVKASGHGRELGKHGIREFTNLKTVWIGD